MGQVISTELTEKDVQNLKSQTNFSSKEIREWFSRFREEFKDGYITKPQFIDMYQNMFPKGDARHFAECVFAAYDTDGNGVVDFKEFISALSVSTRGSVEEKLKWTFSMYDRNKDGRIDREEVTEMVEAIFKLRGRPQAREHAEEAALHIFIALDKNKDGQLSINEFVSGARQTPVIAKLLSQP